MIVQHICQGKQMPSDWEVGTGVGKNQAGKVLIRNDKEKFRLPRHEKADWGEEFRTVWESFLLINLKTEISIISNSIYMHCALPVMYIDTASDNKLTGGRCSGAKTHLYLVERHPPHHPTHLLVCKGTRQNEQQWIVACKSIFTLLAVHTCQGAVDFSLTNAALCHVSFYLFFHSCFDKMKSPGASTQQAAPRRSCCWFSPPVELPLSTLLIWKSRQQTSLTFTSREHKQTYSRHNLQSMGGGSLRKAVACCRLFCFFGFFFFKRQFAQKRHRWSPSDW